MNFAAVAQGSKVFFDANTLIYHFSGDPTFGVACNQLVERVARQQIEGVTSTLVLVDVAHRVMTIEAMTQFGWPAKGIAQRIRQHPAQIQKLTRFRQAIDEVFQFGIHVVPVEPHLVRNAALLSQQFGLLTGDALVVAVMHDQRLIHLASNDADFDRVPGLTRYSPV